jgi:AraC family transcriptional regulator, regulatory protein of adaptative response / methylated-DNA-[protein]-cysteine methyltransferase
MNAAPKISKHSAAVTAACRALENPDEAPSLANLAAAAGMSPFHFHRVFKQATGVTPKAFAEARRSERLRAGLPKNATVTEAIYDAGFSSSGRFYEKSEKMLGMTPQAFRAGGKGETLRFAIGECSLGTILVAASEKGVCCISLGDSPEPLLADLQNRFRNAELVGGDGNFEKLVSRVVGIVETPALAIDLPLDVRGTAFQQRVWEALRKIPVGSTASYTEVANAIGCPKSVRAVASACGANPIAVAIPCHRVVRNDGNLSGYRWGVERKRTLLDREARWAD